MRCHEEAGPIGREFKTRHLPHESNGLAERNDSQ